MPAQEGAALLSPYKLDCFVEIQTEYFLSVYLSNFLSISIIFSFLSASLSVYLSNVCPFLPIRDLMSKLSAC